MKRIVVVVNEIPPMDVAEKKKRISRLKLPVPRSGDVLIGVAEKKRRISRLKLVYLQHLVEGVSVAKKKRRISRLKLEL